MGCIRESAWIAGFYRCAENFRKFVTDYKIHVLDICHTPDERLLEFPKDIATMFLTIKYRENLDVLKKVLQTIPEIENIEKMHTAFSLLQ